MSRKILSHVIIKHDFSFTCTLIRLFISRVFCIQTISSTEVLHFQLRFLICRGIITSNTKATYILSLSYIFLVRVKSLELLICSRTTFNFITKLYIVRLLVVTSSSHAITNCSTKISVNHYVRKVNQSFSTLLGLTLFLGNINHAKCLPDGPDY